MRYFDQHDAKFVGFLARAMLLFAAIGAAAGALLGLVFGSLEWVAFGAALAALFAPLPAFRIVRREAMALLHELSSAAILASALKYSAGECTAEDVNDIAQASIAHARQKLANHHFFALDREAELSRQQADWSMK